MIKREIRVLGIACTTPPRNSAIPIQVVGVVYRGSRWLEGVMRTTVPSDVSDITPSIAKMVIGSPHFPQLRIIVPDQLATKSGSYLDINALSRRTKLPVVAVLRQKITTRRLSSIEAAMPQPTRRTFAKLTCTRWKAGARLFFAYSAGLGKIDLNEILAICASKEGEPEAARVARIIASSLQKFLVRRAPQ